MDKFKINIINFQKFKNELLSNYSEEEILRFFRMFPYDIDSEVSPADKILSVRLEIAFYADLHLIKIKGYEFVLVDQSTETLEGLNFLNEICSQPIILEEFVAISFYDFISIAQADLLHSIHFNLRERESGETKYVEGIIKNGIYI